MQKLGLPFLILLFSNSSLLAGDTLRFAPTMKKGDTRIATIVQTTISNEGGEETIDKEEPITAKFEVTGIDKKYIYIDVLYENVVFKQALKTLEKLDLEGPVSEDLDLKYRIDKLSGESYLINWKETRKFVTGGIDQIVDALDDDTKSFAGLIFQPIKSMFKDEETVQQYFKDNLMLFDDLYSQPFIENDTLHKIDSAENPMMPGKNVVVEYDLVAKNLNSESNTVEIETFADMDMSFIIDMMKQMIQKFSSTEEKADEKLAEANAIKIEMTITENYLYNYETGWPIQITRTAFSDMNAPGKTAKSESKVSITFR